MSGYLKIYSKEKLELSRRSSLVAHIYVHNTSPPNLTLNSEPKPKTRLQWPMHGMAGQLHGSPPVQAKLNYP